MNVLYPRTFISSLLKDIQGAYRDVILRNLFKKNYNSFKIFNPNVIKFLYFLKFLIF